jgi:hypothetical protein
MNLTIAFVTARPEPLWDKFCESFRSQVVRHSTAADRFYLVIVDGLYNDQRSDRFHETAVSYGLEYPLSVVHPKPTVWQGPYRLTKQDWWAMSNARNTAICLCQTEWLACVDDRLTLGPQWLQAVRDAMAGGYAVCGSYEKVDASGQSLGKDCRIEQLKQSGQFGYHPHNAPGQWWYGCSTALPLEWALAVNGYDESCDGSSMEDVIFGMHLANAGYPIKFDPRMHVIEDRTPGQLGPVMKREDKGNSPNDKSHALLDRLKGRASAAHTINLRQIREDLAKGLPFPMPAGPFVDWYDGQPLGEM